MIEDFIIYALAAGSIMAALAGPIGSMMLWRSLSYFGDAMSHTALLGIAGGILLGIGFNAGVFIMVVMCALLFAFLREKKIAKADTLLCIIAQVGLSLGIIAMAFSQTGSSTLMGFLFGDILALTIEDIMYILGVGAVVLAALGFIWNKMILLTFDEETAMAEDKRLTLLNLLYMLLIALFVSLAVKTTGILMVTALLIIPAAAMRHLSKTPETKAVKASVLGVLSVFLGIWLSFRFDLPAGPAIVISAAALGAFSFVFKKR